MSRHDDPDLNDDYAWSIAYHEAGHLVACVLCGVQWMSAWINPDRDRHQIRDGYESLRDYAAGAVDHSDVERPADLAFIAWAGAYAEARYEAECWGGSPWRYLLGTQAEGGQSDLETVWAYYANDANAPHESDEDWARLLDSGWHMVERWAERLVAEGKVESAMGKLV